MNKVIIDWWDIKSMSILTIPSSSSGKENRPAQSNIPKSTKIPG